MALPSTPDAGMQPPDATMDPSGAAPGDGSGGGITVCITDNGDGTYSVGVQGGDMQPASDIKTALTMALSLLRGEAPQDSGAMQGQFDAGFTGGKAPAAAPGLM